MNEDEIIAAEKAMMEQKLKRLLHKVQRTGMCSESETELLTINDLAYMGSSTEGIPCNHLHLTERGKKML